MLSAASLALISVVLIATISIAVLYWTERQAGRAELRHKGQVATESVATPIRVMAKALSEFARSAMFTTAVLDSGDRAAHARPFLLGYSFPVPAANGLVLCDINGMPLAGTRDLANCHANTAEFRQVLADGKTRQVLIRTPDGRRLWTILEGVAFIYTGTIEGVAVGQLDLDQLLLPLPAQLGLASLSMRLRPAQAHEAGTTEAANWLSLEPPPLVAPLSIDAANATLGSLELVLKPYPQTLRDKLWTLLAGYFMATLALILLVIYWARRRSKTLIDPLLALRNRAQAIAETNDLTLPIPKGGIDEVGQLAEAIDSMVRAIRSADATRKEAQERFRLVFETSSEAAIFAWPDGRIESANAEALRLFGYTLDEIRALGRSGVMDINDPRLGPALEQRARTGSFRGELRCRRKDGSLFPVEVVSTLFHDSNGEVRSSSMFRDVTEQKQIHADLQASLETLRIRDNALAAISQGVLISGPDRRITYASEAFQNITGYAASEIIGRSCSLLHGAATNPETKALIQDRLNAGEPFHGEILNYRKNGSSFWNDLSITPVFDSAGTLIQFVGVQRDVSARKQAEQTLQASQNLIKTVFDSLEEQVVVLDPHGIILAANSAWRRFGEENGAPLEVIEGVGLNYLETCGSAVTLNDVDAGEQARAGIETVLSGTSPQFSLNYPCHSPSKLRWFRMQAISLQGTQRGAVVIHENITERIEGEKRLKSLSKNLVEVQEAARRHLASELHDRTSANLAAIVINMDVAWMSLQAREWQVVAERMGDNRALVEDTSASIREICAELRPPALDYAGLIPAIESYANQFAHRTGIAVDIDCLGRDKTLSPAIESILFRIVQEALTNIAKHAQARTVQVQLCLESQPLCLNVVDDGRGFEPGKLHAAQGLGIINMREMAEFAGGSFSLESKPGGGTRIQVELAIQKENS